MHCATRAFSENVPFKGGASAIAFRLKMDRIPFGHSAEDDAGELKKPGLGVDERYDMLCVWICSP